MSDSPRTDAAKFRHEIFGAEMEIVRVDACEAIERELQAAQAELAEARRLGEGSDGCPPTDKDAPCA